MAKYSYELKLSVVHYYLQGKGGYQSASNHFQVEQSAVIRWIALYKQHGADALKKKSYSIYSPEFKRSVIEYMRQHRLSVRKAAIHFNIPGYMTVAHWEKLYDTGKIEAPHVRRGRPKAMAKTPPPSPEKPLEEMTHQELLAEVRYLRTEHAYLKKLDALIQRKQLEEKNKQK
jgi:transposase-like protein